MQTSMIRVRSWSVTPLEVPLVEPFVIACGTVTRTRNALVRVEIEEEHGARAIGIGEAATLTPVTVEDLPDVIASLSAMERALMDRRIAIEPSYRDLTGALDEAGRGSIVARAGAETALLDAIARLAGVPLFELLRSAVTEEASGARAEATGARGSDSSSRTSTTGARGSEADAASRGGDAARARDVTMTTDITIPIRPIATMVRLAEEHRAQGFSCFKVKVGRDVTHDLEAIAAIAEAVPDARFRIDANGGFSAADAIALMERLDARGVTIECFEQPCATEDLDGMAEVTARIAPPVVADESVKRVDDVRAIVARRAARGVNLKLAKSGGPLAALAIGRAAKASSLTIMCGGMVETRLGMTAAAHVTAALGGVDFVDLDTAWLLAEDPFEGGYAARGPVYTLDRRPGLGVKPR